MNTLVVGGAGLLGAAIMRRLASEGIPAASVSRRSAPSIDITSFDSVLRSLDEHEPSAVILAAAAVDVDGVESDPDRAFRINAIGARNVAEACRRRGCGLSFISTDYVFDGALGRPYTEFDNPNPLNVYGRSKLAGERYVLEAGGFRVIRVSYLYGPDGPCFPDRVLRAASSGQPLRLVSDTRVSPTSTRQAARLIVTLSESGGPGIYHVAGGGQASPHEMALRVLAAAGMKPAHVEAIRAGDWPAAAARPLYSVLRPYVLELEHRSDLEPWQDEADHFGREWAARHPV